MISDLCKGCTLCCTSVKGFSDRVPYFNYDKVTKCVKPIMEDDKDGSSCTYLNGCNHCDKYNSRPLVCRWYPFYVAIYPNKIFTIGIAKRSGCKLSEYLINNCMEDSVIELAKNTLIDIRSKLSHEELVDWSFRTSSQYKYMFIYNPEILIKDKNE